MGSTSSARTVRTNSAATSLVGRFLTGTPAGALVEAMGYLNFYLLTTAAALPGIILFWLMMRSGLIDASIGTAGVEGPADARTDGDRLEAAPEQ